MWPYSSLAPDHPGVPCRTRIPRGETRLSGGIFCASVRSIRLPIIHVRRCREADRDHHRHVSAILQHHLADLTALVTRGCAGDYDVRHDFDAAVLGKSRVACDALEPSECDVGD
jgi:hypothetical protein